MLQAADCLYTQGYYYYKPMPVENAEALLAQPNSEDYWDMRRDLMRRDLMRRDLMRRDLMRHDRRVPVSDSEQTALALQAYQIDVYKRQPATRPPVPGTSLLASG